MICGPKCVYCSMKFSLYIRFKDTTLVLINILRNYIKFKKLIPIFLRKQVITADILEMCNINNVSKRNVYISYSEQIYRI